MTSSTKITNKAELANRLYQGAVSKEIVSAKLQRIVELWISRNEIVLVDGFLKLA